jgi:hypothetical protein
VQDLHGLRLHARAAAGGQHDDGQIVVHRYPSEWMVASL